MPAKGTSTTRRGPGTVTSDLWFIAGGIARLFGVLGLVTVGAIGRGSGFGGIGLALLSLALVAGAPLLAVAAIAVAVRQERRRSERLTNAWPIVVMAAAASRDIVWLVSINSGAETLGFLAYAPFVDPVVALLIAPRASRRGAGLYLLLCLTGVAVLLGVSASAGNRWDGRADDSGDCWGRSNRGRNAATRADFHDPQPRRRGPAQASCRRLAASRGSHLDVRWRGIASRLRAALSARRHSTQFRWMGEFRSTTW